MRILLYLAALVFLALPGAGRAESGVTFLTRDEFEKLARDLAPKVDLYRAVWDQDPRAEIFGGPIRDYLFWLKARFRSATTRDEALGISKELRSRELIPAREFLAADSDADIVGNVTLAAADYGIRKIESASPDRFNPDTDAGRTEATQGFLPVEKLRLGRQGFVTWKGFGDGVEEVHSGKITATFVPKEVFDGSHFAKAGLNHEILLVLRLARSLAMNYYAEHGRAYPEPGTFPELPPTLKEKVDEVIKRARTRDEMKGPLSQPRFVEWLNRAIQNPFRANTNPTFSYLLFQKLGLDRFVGSLGNRVEPINQFLLTQARNESAIRRDLDLYGVAASDFYVSPELLLPGLKAFHGTKSDETFRRIFRQGILPSEHGTAGSGLYAVSSRDRGFSEDWAGGADRVIEISILPEARAVDITQGVGKRIYDAYKSGTGRSDDQFAQDFGIDILKYPYERSKEAVVVKNGGVIADTRGLTHQPRSISEELELARNASTEQAALPLARVLLLESLTSQELDLIRQSLPSPDPLALAMVSLARDPDLARIVFAKRYSLFEYDTPGVTSALTRLASDPAQPNAWLAAVLLARNCSMKREIFPEAALPGLHQAILRSSWQLHVTGDAARILAYAEKAGLANDLLRDVLSHYDSRLRLPSTEGPELRKLDHVDAVTARELLISSAFRGQSNDFDAQKTFRVLSEYAPRDPEFVREVLLTAIQDHPRWDRTYVPNRYAIGILARLESWGEGAEQTLRAALDHESNAIRFLAAALLMARGKFDPKIKAALMPELLTGAQFNGHLLEAVMPALLQSPVRDPDMEAALEREFARERANTRFHLEAWEGRAATLLVHFGDARPDVLSVALGYLSVNPSEYGQPWEKEGLYDLVMRATEYPDLLAKAIAHAKPNGKKLITDLLRQIAGEGYCFDLMRRIKRLPKA